jgi:hypothetical protein
MPAVLHADQSLRKSLSAGQEDSPLDLESSSEVVLPDPFWPEYEQSGDANAFAADYALTHPDSLFPNTALVGYFG